MKVTLICKNYAIINNNINNHALTHTRISQNLTTRKGSRAHTEI